MKTFGIWFAVQVAFIVLKITEVITWNWGAVLIPSWFALGLIVGGIFLGIIANFFEELNSRILFEETEE